jgi:hypothetical protein
MRASHILPATVKLVGGGANDFCRFFLGMCVCERTKREEKELVALEIPSTGERQHYHQPCSTLIGSS